jgi:hypothetical protein
MDGVAGAHDENSKPTTAMMSVNDVVDVDTAASAAVNNNNTSHPDQPPSSSVVSVSQSQSQRRSRRRRRKPPTWQLGYDIDMLSSSSPSSLSSPTTLGYNTPTMVDSDDNKVASNKICNSAVCRNCGRNDFKSKCGYAIHVKFCGNKSLSSNVSRRASDGSGNVAAGRFATSSGENSNSSSSSLLWMCQRCGKRSFKSKSGYATHVKYCGNGERSSVNSSSSRGACDVGTKVDSSSSSSIWICQLCGKDSFKAKSGYSTHIKFCGSGDVGGSGGNTREYTSSYEISSVAGGDGYHDSILPLSPSLNEHFLESMIATSSTLLEVEGGAEEIDFRTTNVFDSLSSPIRNNFWETQPLTIANVGNDVGHVNDEDEWMMLEEFVCRPVVVTPNDDDNIITNNKQQETSLLLSSPSTSKKKSTSTMQKNDKSPAIEEPKKTSPKSSSPLKIFSLPEKRFNGRRDLHELITPPNAEPKDCVYCVYKYHASAATAGTSKSNKNEDDHDVPKVSSVKDRCMVCVLPICKVHFDIYHDRTTSHPPVMMRKKTLTATTTEISRGSGSNFANVRDTTALLTRAGTKTADDDMNVVCPIDDDPSFIMTDDDPIISGIVPTRVYNDVLPENGRGHDWPPS